MDELDKLSEDAQDAEDLAPTVVYPPTIGECIDLLFAQRAERLVLSSRVDDMSKAESALRKFIITQLKAAGLEGGKGLAATAGITSKDMPTPKDWPSIWKYIHEHNAFDLLQKRLNVKGIAERWDHGEEVPGVEHFTVEDLSLTKRSK